MYFIMLLINCNYLGNTSRILRSTSALVSPTQQRTESRLLPCSEIFHQFLVGILVIQLDRNERVHGVLDHRRKGKVCPYGHIALCA